MRAIWEYADDGTSGHEAAFILNGTEANPRVIMEGRSDTIGEMQVTTFADTFAVVHVHPNDGGPIPSTPDNNIEGNDEGDTGIADRLHLDVYVESSRGLTVYYWRTRRIVWLRAGMNWIKECAK